jgi:hypothetical protein
MATYTVVSKSTDGKNHRSLTVGASSKEEAQKAADAQNKAIADQEQTEAYVAGEATKD